MAGNKAHDKIILRIDLGLSFAKHLHAGVNQKRAEDVNDPMKTVDQLRARQNHRHAHYQRAQHAPIQNAMLVFRRNFEVGKDQEKKKQVINRQRQLDEIAGNELESLLVAGGSKQLPAKRPKQ